MPVHNWTRVPSGVFHHFHQDWTIEIARTLNRGVLPRGYSALAEQRADGMIPDVLTVQSAAAERSRSGQMSGGVMTMELPKARFVQRSAKDAYAARANRIVVKHALGRVVSVIEIVSPGNKDTKLALRTFVDKTLEFFRNGVHLLIVDLFPPSSRDPQGIHQFLWDELYTSPFELPTGKQLTVGSYCAGAESMAFIETIGFGDPLPSMGLFLDSKYNVPVPLEETYQAAWESCPEDMRIAVETGVMPNDSEA